MSEHKHLEQILKQAADMLRKHGAIVLLREEIVAAHGLCQYTDYDKDRFGNDPKWVNHIREYAARNAMGEIAKQMTIEERDGQAPYDLEMHATAYVVKPDSARRALEQFGRSSQIPPLPRVTDIFGDPDKYEIVRQPPDLRHLKL